MKKLYLILALLTTIVSGAWAGTTTTELLNQDFTSVTSCPSGWTGAGFRSTAISYGTTNGAVISDKWQQEYLYASAAITNDGATYNVEFVTYASTNDVNILPFLSSSSYSVMMGNSYSDNTDVYFGSINTTGYAQFTSFQSDTQSGSRTVVTKTSTITGLDVSKSLTYKLTINGTSMTGTVSDGTTTKNVSFTLSSSYSFDKVGVQFDGAANTAGVKSIKVTKTVESYDVTYKYVDANGKTLADDVIETAGTTYNRTLPESISSTYELTSMNLTSQEGTDVTFSTSAAFTANTTVYVTCQKIIAHTWSWTDGGEATTTLVDIDKLHDGNISNKAYLNRNQMNNDQLLITFSKTIKLNRFRAIYPNSGVAMKKLADDKKNTLDVSADGETWTTVATFGNDESTHTSDDFDLTSAEATNGIKYVRVHATGAINWMQCNEIIMEYEIAEVDATMNITSAGWATFCAPFEVTLSDNALAKNVKAYTGEIANNSWVKLTEVENNTITAGTPVVLSGEEYTETYTAVPTYTESTTPKYGCLTGNLTGAVKEVATGNYLLQNGSEGLGWYKVAQTGLNIGKNRCYMTMTSGNNAREFFGMSLGETTAIQNIATEAKTKSDGKYLVNGRLVIVKSGKAYNANGVQY